MVALYPVGKSSYGELRGLTQYVVDPLVAAHVNALIEESKSVFGAGAVLSVNEGNRSRARQKYLRGKWEDYRFNGGPWAALAAALYTSTHDESRGNAIDFGVTTRTGGNRSLTMSEHAWLVTRGKAHGVIWTGGDPTFMRPAELWHFNGYPARATIPASSGAVIIPDTPTTPDVSEEDDDMNENQQRVLQEIHNSLNDPTNGVLVRLTRIEKETPGSVWSHKVNGKDAASTLLDAASKVGDVPAKVWGVLVAEQKYSAGDVLKQTWTRAGDSSARTGTLVAALQAVAAKVGAAWPKADK